MKSFLSSLRTLGAGLFGLALALSAGSASAAATNIAQLPVLNVNGTGQVKPNLMLLYDNSGSMAYTFTPDYIDDGNTCRSRLLMSSGTRSCSVGQPPFNSPDFNRQSYNPKVRYLPPVYADGTYYPSQTSANTTAWTVVSTDPFGKNKTNLLGAGADTTDLVNNFPDLKWCDTSGNNCVFNTATYSYPSDTRYTAYTMGGNPYYYNINVAEFCTDATLTTCISTAVGAAAPAGYPMPAKVRWCNSRALTTCQAKYVGAYVYPRFSNPNSGVVGAYGTLTIGASAGATSVSISSVSVVESGATVVITNGSVTASGGTNTLAKQTQLANDVAASIIAKTGLTNQYTACVRTPSSGSTVPNCATAFGITLGANNIVAIVPIDCAAGATSKDIGQCSLLADNTRNGWAISAVSPASVATPAKGATAVLTVSGTGKDSNNNRTTLASLKLGGTSIMGSLTFARNVGSADAAAAIAAAISGTGVTAVQGGSTGCTTGASTVCITTTANLAAGQAITVGAITNNGSMAFSPTATTAGAPATYDTVATTSAPIGAGSAVFVRVDIVPSRTSYPKDTVRTDCAGATCTYAEEMTNFANWYAYYKSRNQMMKTAVGQAFNPISANFNVGIASLSNAAAGGSLTRPRPFNETNRGIWFTALYNMTGSSTTPLRPALHAIGKMYANKSPYIQAANDEVVLYPCQQNFTFMTTDGYWNGAAAADVVSNDNVESTERFCSRADGCVDTRTQSDNSLADVALYWYNGGSNATGGSLRPTLEDMNKPGLVPAPAGENTHLHMNTYTLGLGVDGIMNYEENYDTSPISGGDFSKLINGVTTGCPWNNNGAYVWPDPATGDSSTSTVQARVDDLWHAAINGHGKYFSASDPTQVVAGLQSALSNIATRSGAAASASTSSPNITQADNDIFSVSFTTVKWNGVITDRKIDVATGAILPTEIWNSSNMVGRKVDQSSDTRVIKMLVPAASPATATLKDFTYANMTATEKAWFDNKCTSLAQCTTLTVENRAILNSGTNIVNWLRGQQQYANDVLLRAYTQTAGAPQGLTTTIPIVLGDIASSKPAYISKPTRSYTTDGYSEYKTAQAARPATVYVAANDGMLHAFNAVTGEERWAYVPRITMKKLAVQASTGYGTNHQYTTDGSPEVSDVQINGVWKTVLVAGLNGGGRGFYAIDVTNPLVPVALWETCADATICTGTNNEPEMGLSFGNPLMGMWKPSSAAPAKWVVFLTSGYNNVPGSDGVAGAGTGKGWLMIVDIATGAVLSKVSTESGDTTTPSGFTRITGISANPVTDPLVTYIYGGDNLGQMWRFDLTSGGTPTVVRMGNAGALQPITTRPDVTLCAVTTTVDGITSTSNKMVVAYGTGRLLDVSDVANTDVQGVYVVRDRSTSIGATMTPTEWRASMAQENLLKTTTSGTTKITISGPAVNLSTKQGWFTDFNQTAGERVNLDVKIVSGLLNVVTNIPSASSACSIGGSANLYSFDVCTSVGDSANGGQVGTTLSPNSALVGYVILGLSNGIKQLTGTDAGGGNPIVALPDKDGAKARRSGWRRIQN